MIKCIPLPDRYANSKDRRYYAFGKEVMNQLELEEKVIKGEIPPSEVQHLFRAGNLLYSYTRTGRLPPRALKGLAFEVFGIPVK